MALEVMSGAVYHDTTKNVQKNRTDAGPYEPGTANLNVTEVPAITGTTKSTGGNQTGKDQEKGQNQSNLTDQDIKNAVDKANNKMKEHRTRCEFEYHKETNRVSIKVYDQDTEEVIREIPPEETLEMLQKMWEMTGLIVDEKR